MRILYYVIAAAAVGGLASCGSKADKAMNQALKDSAVTAEIEAEAPGLPVYTLTKDSLGPVHVGEEIANLPKAVPDLYDTVLPTETPDAMAYTYLLGDIPQFTIYDFMEGRVDVIVLEGNARAVKTPKGEVRVDDPFTKVLELPGVQSEYQSLDDMGIWYWVWNGLYFGVNESKVSEKLGEALCDGKRPPRAADLQDATIGYIGTGLPF